MLCVRVHGLSGQDGLRVRVPGTASPKYDLRITSYEFVGCMEGKEDPGVGGVGLLCRCRRGGVSGGGMSGLPASLLRSYAETGKSAAPIIISMLINTNYDYV